LKKTVKPENLSGFTHLLGAVLQTIFLPFHPFLFFSLIPTKTDKILLFIYDFWMIWYVFLAIFWVWRGKNGRKVARSDVWREKGNARD
jgi:hypothetical protein